MKIFKPIIIILIMCVIITPLISCGGSESDEALPEEQPATVQRGNLTIDITAAGNLALSRTEDLAIDLFFQQGTIEEVLVEEGDTVEEGQVLVRLDTEEWDDELSLVEKAVVTAQRNLTTKQSALSNAERQVITLERLVTTKEIAVTAAERQVATKELAVRQEQLDVQTAENTLSEIDEVKEAQDDVEEAEEYLKLVKLIQTGALGGGVHSDLSYWNLQKVNAEEQLATTQEVLAEILEGTSLLVTDDIALEVDKKQLLLDKAQMDLEDAEVAVETAERAVDDAKYALEDAQLDVEDAKRSVEDAELNLADAEQAVEDAQKDLEDAQSKSPEIRAPFDGFITSVKVEGGDEVLKGTVAIQIADPNKFEADILVSEMDIMQVELEGEAYVEVDAMQGMSLPAKVTHIAPTATIQAGVVNYSVTVEVESLEAVVKEGQETMQQAMADIAAGELPPPLQRAVDEGRMTQEEAEAIIKQGPPEGFEPPEGFTPPEGMEFPTGTGSQAQGQLPSMATEDFQLREGLTVTVSIIVAERYDVLLVPNAAITTERMQSYVEVILPSGETEKRAIQTGISDYQFTEVTEGLEEGEEVLVPQGTVTTTSNEERPRGMMMFGGPPR